jgi:hypothetical protein
MAVESPSSGMVPGSRKGMLGNKTTKPAALYISVSATEEISQSAA